MSRGSKARVGEEEALDLETGLWQPTDRRGHMDLFVQSVTLYLADTFTISRLSVDSLETCFITLEYDGIIAYGEGSLGPTDDSVDDDFAKAIEADGSDLLRHDLEQPDRVLQRLEQWDGPTGAKMALDGAVHDWFGKHMSAPLWRLLGGSRVVPKRTGFTLGIASVEETIAKIKRAPKVGTYKVKVGGTNDLERLEAVRSVTAVPLRVDGNEGWTFDTARWLTPRLVELGVELLEQPFPSAAIDDHYRYRELPRRLPLFVDEGCSDVDSMVRASHYADGVVVKLSKSGGINATRRVMQEARARGLKVMLSCMCESQLAISQAALLAPLADYIDLDSHLMLSNTPFSGLALGDGHIVLTEAPGLGLTPCH